MNLPNYFWILQKKKRFQNQIFDFEKRIFDFEKRTFD